MSSVSKKKTSKSIDNQVFEIELLKARELTGLPLTVRKSVDTILGSLPLPRNRYVLDYSGSIEDYVMSRELTKEELYDCLYVLNHVLTKMQKLGRIQQPHKEEQQP